jgi:hypothetical protein
VATEHGFKQEQKKDNKVQTTGKTPKNKNNRRNKGKGSPTLDPALLQAIMMLLAQRGESMEGPEMGGMGGMPMGLPPGAVQMGPPAQGNPSMQGRMGMMPPMPGAMPQGGMPVR